MNLRHTPCSSGVGRHALLAAWTALLWLGQFASTPPALAADLPRLVAPTQETPAQESPVASPEPEPEPVAVAGDETPLPLPLPEGGVAATPETPAFAPAPCGSEVWLISTRQGCAGGRPRLMFWRRHGFHWDAAHLEDFLASTHPAAPTCFWVHGNRESSQAAEHDGGNVFLRMKRFVPPGCGFRFVIWSWPSDKIHGPVRDLRVKAARSDAQAYPLAWLIAQMPPDAPVTLCGYSYGARLVTGALHLLGGGALAGRRLPMEAAPPRTRPMRGVLVAGALDQDSLAPGHRNGLALSQVQGMLITVNHRDPALKWYAHLFGLHGPRAIGRVGAAGYTPGVWQTDVTSQVGKSHELSDYVAAPGCWSRVSQFALFGRR